MVYYIDVGINRLFSSSARTCHVRNRFFHLERYSDSADFDETHYRLDTMLLCY